MHEECYNKKNKEKSQNEIEYEDLQNYIKKLFNTTYVNKKIITQIKDYREQYSYTYTGIKSTLIWWFELQHHSIEEANGGIGIVPFVYTQAEAYYRGLYEAQNINSEYDIINYQPKVKEITIAPPENKIIPKLFDLDWEDN